LKFVPFAGTDSIEAIEKRSEHQKKRPLTQTPLVSRIQSARGENDFIAARSKWRKN
jgi:hypothetical protein